MAVDNEPTFAGSLSSDGGEQCLAEWDGFDWERSFISLYCYTSKAMKSCIYYFVMQMQQQADNVDVGSQNNKDNLKASNFPITTFTVGNWKRDSNLEGELTAKFYYGMKKLVWEFLLNGPLKTKMEVCWSDITAIEAVINPNQPGFLRIELAKPPLFFREIPPQPRKRTTWEPADDFTNGQAQLCRKHEATFPPGALDKHYEKLPISDGRLAELSRRPFPTFFPLQQTPQQQLSTNEASSVSPDPPSKP
ncbi:uncharacterized protein LOC121795398 [Salvia splendens]|uniref:uncharacterized protein LOC121795398 n=1 Tax=Salvia splendens TaxID=180675 RepID=UPI001C265DF4|nr:uncharacterized protein LOC121795398 [Salvia splendens]